ncbi:hypothetical protein BH11ACT4_BH11ACT4_20130 [soil metagenome]
MAAQRPPAIVAELGRPETPEETAARRAENSRRHRSNQTLLNLVVALVASLGIVLFLVVIVVRPQAAPVAAVDYRAIAADAQSGTSEQLIVPTLPEGWSSNRAEFGTTAEVLDWYIGFLTPSTQFIALDQGIDANPTWRAGVLDNAKSTGAVSIDGLDWTIYDRRTVQRPGNFAYSMSTTIGASTVLLHGTASTEEFQVLAAAIAAEAGDH